ncbi:FHA domain-containing protein FhaB/FipA [Luethyella okanaganae]|uniref:FHA domain-containing protein n=1 Tax=Luethyella okanaganae TaxID=69372 RepID=A0ABW1VHJ7_9MICO
MSELTLLVLRLGFLLLLWLFIFAIVYSLRSDLFGQRVRKLQPADVTAGSVGGGAARSSGGSDSATAATPLAAFGREIAGVGTASKLVITSGVKAGAEFPLGRDEITIGRSSDSTIIIRDDYTSTHHARLMLWNDQWMIQDLDSTNGTFLDGARVAVPTPVPLNTPIKIGATSFELRR